MAIGVELGVVRDEPLTLMLKLYEGRTPGRPEAAEAFAEIIAEMRSRYPGRTFQLIPFSYAMLDGVHLALDAILAVANEAAMIGRVVASDAAVEALLDMPAESFFSRQRFLDCGVPKLHIYRTVQSVRTACRFDYTELRQHLGHPVPERPIRTMREFLRRYENFDHLTRVPNFGTKTQEALKKVARSAGSPLPASWS